MSRPRIASAQARGRARQQTRVREAADAASASAATALPSGSTGEAAAVAGVLPQSTADANVVQSRQATQFLPPPSAPAAVKPPHERPEVPNALGATATKPKRAASVEAAAPPSAANPCAAAPPGQRERNREANRNTILDAARKAFLKLGYDALTIRDVVRRTGLAAGTFYNYFTDKDVLFKAVMEARIGEVTHAMHAARMQATSVAGFIFAAYHALFAQIASDPSFFQLILRNEHAVRTLFEDTVNGFPLHELKDDIREFVRRGVFPEIDVELLAAAFYGVGFEMGRHLATHPRPDAAAATAGFATRLLTAGISGFGLGTVPIAPHAGGWTDPVPVTGAVPKR